MRGAVQFVLVLIDFRFGLLPLGRSFALKLLIASARVRLRPEWRSHSPRNWRAPLDAGATATAIALALAQPAGRNPRRRAGQSRPAQREGALPAPIVLVVAAERHFESAAESLESRVSRSQLIIYQRLAFAAAPRARNMFISRPSRARGPPSDGARQSRTGWAPTARRQLSRGSTLLLLLRNSARSCLICCRRSHRGDSLAGNNRAARERAHKSASVVVCRPLWDGRPSPERPTSSSGRRCWTRASLSESGGGVRV